MLRRAILEGRLQARETIAESEWITSFESLSDAMRQQEQRYADIAVRLKWFVPQNLPYTVVSYFVEVSELMLARFSGELQIRHQAA